MPLLPRIRRPYLVLLVIVFALINSAVLFWGRTLIPIVPSNMVVPNRPYGYKGPSLDWTTTVDPFGSMNVCYAFDAYTANCLKKGIIPFWDPYQGLGQPFLAGGLSAVLYPINWLHVVLPPAWWDIVFLLNWLLAALFLYAYLKILGIEPPAAFVGAMAVFASGAIQVYLPLREVPAVAAWWPLLLYGIERTCQQPDWRSRHLVLALGVFCSITGGQPEVTFVSLLAISTYAALRVLSARTGAFRLIARLAPGAAAGLLLSAPHWINFADYAFTAFSTHTPGGGNGLIHLPFQTIASYFFPYFYGRVQTNPFALQDFSWAYSPGWSAPLCLSLAIASIAAFKAKPRLGLAFLWLVCVLTLAKIYGVPGINSLGSLPHLERVIFPRYASFLPGLALAGLAAYGISLLAGATNRTWFLWIVIWTAIICGVFALGVQSIWSPLSNAAPGSDPRRIFSTFGLGGLAWALIQPLGLWWIRYRRPADPRGLYAAAAFGILVHGVAFAPRGYSISTYSALSLAGLISFVLFAGATGIIHRRPLDLGINLAGASVLAILPILVAATNQYGLPSRYDPLTRPPILAHLINLQEAGRYRSYSLDGMPSPDFAAPFELSSLDNLDAICPAGTARFVLDYLDSGLFPIVFTGNRSAGPAYGTAFDQIKKNKRYYNLVAVKYIVTDGPTLGSYAYDTNTGPGNSRPVPITGPVAATLLSPVDDFSTIEVPFGTYGKKNPGILALQVLDQDGKVIDSSEIQAPDLIDNQYRDFHFSGIHGVKGKSLRLSLTFRPGSKDAMIAAYVPSGPSSVGFSFRIPVLADELHVLYRDPDTGAVIWENPEAAPRVFLAPEAIAASSEQDALSRLKDIPNISRTVLLDPGQPPQPDPNPAQPPGTLEEFHLSPNEVTIRYNANLPGILTLVDSFSDGWHAEVNGNDAPVLRVDGVFRGVKIDVPGPLNVRFWYRPPHWNLSLTLCSLGLIILAFPLMSLLRSVFSRPRAWHSGN